jgi:hypothetical protein
LIEDHPQTHPSIRSRNYPLNPIILTDDGARARLFEEKLGKVPTVFQGLRQYLGKVEFRNHRDTS